MTYIQRKKADEEKINNIFLVYVKYFHYICKTIMEEILLRLVCEEYEISEELLFSDSRHDVVYKPLSMMTYILRIKYNWKVADIYNFYRKKGYPKSRSAIYNHLKAVINDIYYNEYSRIAYDSIIKLMESLTTRGLVEEDNDNLHILRGRLVTKLFLVKEQRKLADLYKEVDRYLHTQFIKEGQFEEV